MPYWYANCFLQLDNPICFFILLGFAGFPIRVGWVHDGGILIMKQLGKLSVYYLVIEYKMGNVS